MPSDPAKGLVESSIWRSVPSVVGGRRCDSCVRNFSRFHTERTVAKWCWNSKRIIQLNQCELDSILYNRKLKQRRRWRQREPQKKQQLCTWSRFFVNFLAVVARGYSPIGQPINSTLIETHEYHNCGWTRMYEARTDLGKVLVTIVWRSLLAWKTWQTKIFIITIALKFIKNYSEWFWRMHQLTQRTASDCITLNLLNVPTQSLRGIRSKRKGQKEFRRVWTRKVFSPSCALRALPRPSSSFPFERLTWSLDRISLSELDTV